MTDDLNDERLPMDEPAYVISVAAKLVCLHPQTLRYYERLGLVKPRRTSGRIRLYSRRNIEVLRRIARLTEDLGVNLAGVEVIMNMSERLSELQEELEQERTRFQHHIARLAARIRELEGENTGAETATVIKISAPISDPESPSHDDDEPSDTHSN